MPLQWTVTRPAERVATVETRLKILTRSGPLATTVLRKPRVTAVRAWPALELILSLWLSQTVGLLHRVVHAQAEPGFPQQTVVANTDGERSHEVRFVSSLVPKHDDPQPCAAFDHLSLGSAIAGVAAAVCVPAAFIREPVLRWFHVARDDSKHDFQARAPPLAGMS